jgi:hypothetical protein
MNRLSIRMRPGLHSPVFVPGRSSIRRSRLGKGRAAMPARPVRAVTFPGQSRANETPFPTLANTPASPRPAPALTSDLATGGRPAWLNVALPEPGERTAQDAWYAIEDLWTRLSLAFTVSTYQRDGCWHMAVQGCAGAPPSELDQLLQAATDPGLFTWRAEGRHGSFLRELVCEGDAIFVRLAAMEQICRWLEGDDLGWQVLSLMSKWRVQRATTSAGHAG